MLRLRFRAVTWPRRALVLTDTPRPRCPDCQGKGGQGHASVSPDGEFDGIEYEVCPCWDETRSWVLLPLPRRTPPGWYSDEPPY